MCACVCVSVVMVAGVQGRMFFVKPDFLTILDTANGFVHHLDYCYFVLLAVLKIVFFSASFLC